MVGPERIPKIFNVFVYILEPKSVHLSYPGAMEGSVFWFIVCFEAESHVIQVGFEL